MLIDTKRSYTKKIFRLPEELVHRLEAARKNRPGTTYGGIVEPVIAKIFENQQKHFIYATDTPKNIHGNILGMRDIYEDAKRIRKPLQLSNECISSLNAIAAADDRISVTDIICYTLWKSLPKASPNKAKDADDIPLIRLLDDDRICVPNVSFADIGCTLHSLEDLDAEPKVPRVLVDPSLIILALLSRESKGKRANVWLRRRLNDSQTLGILTDHLSGIFTALLDAPFRNEGQMKRLRTRLSAVFAKTGMVFFSSGAEVLKNTLRRLEGFSKLYELPEGTKFDYGAAMAITAAEALWGDAFVIAAASTKFDVFSNLHKVYKP